MKISRLTSTRPLPGPNTPATRQRVAARESVAPVDTTADTDADRRRSRQQDLEEMEPQAMAPFVGREQMRQSVHELAKRLANLGPGGVELLVADTSLLRRHAIDTKA